MSGPTITDGLAIVNGKAIGFLVNEYPTASHQIKKVVNKDDIVNTDQLSKMKIYAFRRATGTVFKLHSVRWGWRCPERFAFCSMDHSASCTKVYDSMREAIEDQINDVWQFNDQEDFFNWAVKQKVK